MRPSAARVCTRSLDAIVEQSSGPAVMVDETEALDSPEVREGAMLTVKYRGAHCGYAASPETMH